MPLKVSYAVSLTVIRDFIFLLFKSFELVFSIYCNEVLFLLSFFILPFAQQKLKFVDFM